MKYQLLIFCLVLYSCFSQSGCPSEAAGCQDDTIKPSSKELWFSAKGGIDSVVTEGDDWLIDNIIIIGDSSIYLGASDISYSLNEENYYYDSQTGEKMYYEYDVISIESSWFSVNKTEKNKIIFSVKQNETGENRKFYIFLSDRNYFTGIWTNQSAE